jgi:hypothetical protein
MEPTLIQVVLGIVASYVMQALKKTSLFPLVTEGSGKLIKVLFSGLIAAGTALGVQFIWDPTLGQLTLTGLTWSHVGNALLAFLVSFLSQHIAYEGLIHKRNGGQFVRKFGVFVLAAALSLPLGACGVIHNPFKVPAAVVAANAQGVYTADQVVTRIREFQKLVIDYSRSGIIPMQTGREIVMWSRASMETIGAVPDGWQATVKKGWENVRPKVEKLPAVATWAPIIDALIGFVAPNPIFSPQAEAERRVAIGEATRWLLEE